MEEPRTVKGGDLWTCTWGNGWSTEVIGIVAIVRERAVLDKGVCSWKSSRYSACIHSRLIHASESSICRDAC